MDNIFFSKQNQHMALTVGLYRDTQSSRNLYTVIHNHLEIYILSLSVKYAKRLNPLKCAFFDRLQSYSLRACCQNTQS